MAEHTFLSVPFEDGKKCYVGQFVKICVSVQSDTKGETTFNLHGHVIRCEYADAQTIVEIEHI